MKKFLKTFFSRILWCALFFLAQIAFIVYLILEAFKRVDLIGSDYSWIFVVIIAVWWVSALITMIYIINSKSNNAYKALWLFVVGIIPIMGIILYLIFGNKNTSKRNLKKIQPQIDAMRLIKTPAYVEHKLTSLEGGELAHGISKYITNEVKTSIYNGTETTYFPLGDLAYEPFLDALRNAKHYIHLEFFIIKNGKFFDSVLTILKEKAKEGVNVRLMYDDFGAAGELTYSFPERMKKFGIEVIAYNRLKPLLTVRFNNRDHRKIAIIDGYIGFTGGINIADEYINQKVRFGHWLDNFIMLKGKGVYALNQLFLCSWCAYKKHYEEISNEKYNYDYYLPKGTSFKNDGYVQPYGDIPFDDEAVGQKVYLSLIYGAKKSLYITTPYLILDDETITALETASKKGVDVKILTPHIPDKKIVFNVTRSYYEKLLNSGCHIYEYTPGFVHEKIFVVDDIMATIGTINLDFRSLYLNRENAIFLFHTSSINDMSKAFLDSVSKSEEITIEKFARMKKGKRVIWSILRLLAPLM